MDASSPAPGPRNESLGDILPLRVQAGLFVLLAAFLGIVAWKAWQPPPVEPPQRSALVDLNRADREAILTLHGIGPELADRIVAYRQTHGPFESLADLRKVAGIGPAKIDQLRPQVSLSWPPATEAVRESGGETGIVPASLLRKEEDVSILNPNTATFEELRTLPGIGQVLAQRIIDKRKAQPFVDIAELRKVQGIGPKTFDRIKSRLAISQPTARLQ